MVLEPTRPSLATVEGSMAFLHHQLLGRGGGSRPIRGPHCEGSTLNRRQNKVTCRDATQTGST